MWFWRTNFAVESLTLKIYAMTDKPLFSLTADEFKTLIKEAFAELSFSTPSTEGVAVKKHFVYGLQGLADLFGCSHTTASRIKQSGIIDAAISQRGKTIVVDADYALELMKVHKHIAKRSNNRK